MIPTLEYAKFYSSHFAAIHGDLYPLINQWFTSHPDRQVCVVDDTPIAVSDYRIDLSRLRATHADECSRSITLAELLALAPLAHPPEHQPVEFVLSSETPDRAEACWECGWFDDVCRVRFPLPDPVGPICWERFLTNARARCPAGRWGPTLEKDRVKNHCPEGRR